MNPHISSTRERERERERIIISFFLMTHLTIYGHIGHHLHAAACCSRLPVAFGSVCITDSGRLANVVFSFLVGNFCSQIIHPLNSHDCGQDNHPITLTLICASSYLMETSWTNCAQGNLVELIIIHSSIHSFIPVTPRKNMEFQQSAAIRLCSQPTFHLIPHFSFLLLNCSCPGCS
jgi:hypothetical protein